MDDGLYTDIYLRADMVVTVRLSDGEIVNRSLSVHTDDGPPEMENVYRVKDGEEFDIDSDPFVEEIRAAEIKVAEDAQKLEAVPSS